MRSSIKLKLNACSYLNNETTALVAEKHINLQIITPRTRSRPYWINYIEEKDIHFAVEYQLDWNIYSINANTHYSRSLDDFFLLSCAWYRHQLLDRYPSNWFFAFYLKDALFCCCFSLNLFCVQYYHLFLPPTVIPKPKSAHASIGAWTRNCNFKASRYTQCAWVCTRQNA